MPRTNWNVYFRESGESWTADGTIPAPNSDLNIPVVSTQIKLKGADGDNLFVTPPTKFVKELLEFVFINDDGTIKNKIDAYIQNQTNLKIVDSDSVEYIGRFISLIPAWIVGLSPNTYDLRVTFEQMPNL